MTVQLRRQTLTSPAGCGMSKDVSGITVLTRRTPDANLPLYHLEKLKRIGLRSTLCHGSSHTQMNPETLVIGTLQDPLLKFAFMKQRYELLTWLDL